MRAFRELFIGLSGVGGVELANNVEIPTGTETKDVVSVIVQILIGIATIVGMFKKKKEKI